MPKPSVRADADACPGALRLHVAADGPLARVRLPGGRMTGAQLRTVRKLAEECGDGHVELTSRANLQLRALKNAPAVQLATRLGAAGLLPSPTHELVRNIAASPLAGGPIDVPSQVAALDRGLCADPALASLPGRFLFAVDNGQGDVASGADTAALPLGDEVAILFAGTDAGLRVTPDEVVPALLAAAHAFLDERAAQEPRSQPPSAGPRTASGRFPQPSGGDPDAVDVVPGRQAHSAPSVEGGRRVAWRVRELADGPARVAARTAAALGRTLGAPAVLSRPGVREPIGLIEQPGGLVTVGALVPLGRLSGVQLRVLESAATVVFTPWRGVVVPDLTPAAAESWIAALAGAGLEVAGGSRWVGVTTCAGQPGCAKSLADVRHDAFAATTAGDGLPVHWVGCERGCGSPAVPHVRVEATGSGYVVRSPHACGFAPAGDTTRTITTVSAATDDQANSGTAGGEAPTGGMAGADVGALISAARKV